VARFAWFHIDVTIKPPKLPLSLPIILSGAKAFEINDIQACTTLAPGPIVTTLHWVRIALDGVFGRHKHGAVNVREDKTTAEFCAIFEAKIISGTIGIARQRTELNYAFD
jgi:hypothetical protein